MSQTKTILFGVSKKESHTPTSGFKRLYRRLRNDYKVTTLTDEVSTERLQDADVVVFGGPREKFTGGEFNTLTKYVEGGGSVVIMLEEGGESKLGTNVNYFAEDFGISANSDSVIRTVYRKYFHPKEVLVTNGILNRGINRAAGKQVGQSETGDLEEGLSYVYPYGCSLSVQKPAIPIMGSGVLSYPLNQPVGGICEKGEGRLLVLGSVQIFSDNWLTKEENQKLGDVLFKWLVHSDEVKMDPIDADDPGTDDYHYLPNIGALSERLKSCLQESEDVQKDFTLLFEQMPLFQFDTNLVPEVVRLYKELRVKYERMSFIPPEFEISLPPLKPAFVPPQLAEPQPPALDLFDLDDAFASETGQLARLTNKCKENPKDDLEYFIQQAGKVVGITDSLPENLQKNPKELLVYLLQKVVEWKKVSQDGLDGMIPPPENMMMQSEDYGMSLEQNQYVDNS